jgi:hypothetical protein
MGSDLPGDRAGRANAFLGEPVGAPPGEPKKQIGKAARRATISHRLRPKRAERGADQRTAVKN